MHKLKPSQFPLYVAGAFLQALLAGCIFSAFSQVPVSETQNLRSVELTAITSDSLVKLDGFAAIKVIAENKGRKVEEAVVSLVDSASGDTIQNWYPLFPPESADSIVLIWNTKGTKPGAHVLVGFLNVSSDSAPPPSRLSRKVTVVR